MDTNSILSRRTLLKAAPVAAAAVALPTASATEAAAQEENGDRLDRLMHEISEILDTALMGTFCAVIQPSKRERAMVMLKPNRDVENAFALAHFVEHAGHHALVEYHMAGVARAMRKQHGGCWIAHAEEAGGARIYRDPNAADGIWVSFPVGV